jgi:MoxR-like ATPase
MAEVVNKKKAAKTKAAADATAEDAAAEAAAAATSEDVADLDATGPAHALEQERVDEAREVIERIVKNVDSVIQGKHDVVELVVLALVARGHVLLEDLPGTGKTTLVSMLARSVDCGFSRIQFTPDVMPSDVSGFSIFNQRTQDFEFRPGGVMSNLVLADEINRASAKTQSALLEAMEERQVTVDGITHLLEEPFMVLATQNPIEQFGTYPLPEAQLDRFLAQLSMGYPDFAEEVHVLELGDDAKHAVRPVATGADVLGVRAAANDVYASKMIMRYVVQIITATRDNPEVQVGASPRGGIALLALSRAFALTRGRGYVLPDDVKGLAPHVLRHRLILSHEAKVAGRTPDDVIASILSGIAVPYYDEDEARGLKESKGGDVFVR